MSMIPKLQEYLDQHVARYTHSVHPLAYTARQVARAEEVPPHEVAKTIVFFGDHGYGMAILPANRLVNMQELREALGFNRLRLATEEELAGLFPDAELGAQPPFGNLYGMPVYLDGELALEDVIAFNAGTHRDVVHMRFNEFVNLVKPTILSFSKVT
jgi:Ala-tRNA(Pro) deacylase